MAQVNERDWVEGEPRWWWKYVFPAKAQFWQLLAVMKAEPLADPRLHAFSGEVQEGLAMVNASPSITDKEASARLKNGLVAEICG